MAAAPKNRQEFEIVEKLGEGSYGSVWKCKSHKKLFAIKRIPCEEGDDMEDVHKEIQFMQQLRSPFVVQYFGSFTEPGEGGGVLWICMEYMSGGSLSDIMKTCEQTLDERQIQCVLKTIVPALDFLHSHSKIHRDVKAGNILVNAHGECKLADFGVSSEIANSMALHHTMIGSPYWMSPELIEDKGYDTKTDIWSLGITIIEIGDGEPPYIEMAPLRAIFTIPNRPPPTFKSANVLGQWSSLITQFLALCLIKDPAQRASAHALMEHPFLRAAPQSNEPLLELLRMQATIFKAKGGRENVLQIREKGVLSPETVIQTMSHQTVDRFSEFTSTEDSGTCVFHAESEEAAAVVEDSGTRIIHRRTDAESGMNFFPGGTPSPTAGQSK